MRVALDFAAKNKDTLVIVTADHAHTSQIVEADANPAGASSILVTNEGSPMMVTYGTAAGDPRASRRSTPDADPRRRPGPPGGNVVGLIDQTDLFEIMARALGVG